ncbi:MAG: substrate-binding domain-containing protein [Tissierellia bacterium]|nr:substrate-binding domain-containing protein [Tissierellia bacterium]
MKHLKLFIFILTLAAAVVFTGCSQKSTTPEKSKETKKTDSKDIDSKQDSEGTTLDTEIHVVSREAGSGTRGALTEIVGIVEKDKDGNEVDRTYIEATIENGTDSVLTTVQNDVDAIGYISLGSLNDTVKALKVQGVEATASNVKDGSYPIARPFNLVFKKDQLGELEKDFMNYIMSKEGAAIIEKEGYIAVSNEKSYTPSGMEGAITIAGSTSVTPVIEKLVDGYKALNPGFKADIQATGSSAGIQSATEGIAHIGMASRELKEKEKEHVDHMVMAMDGIAVIIHLENPAEDVSLDQIREMFVGELTNWANVK